MYKRQALARERTRTITHSAEPLAERLDRPVVGLAVQLVHDLTRGESERAIRHECAAERRVTVQSIGFVCYQDIPQFDIGAEPPWGERGQDGHVGILGDGQEPEGPAP